MDRGFNDDELADIMNEIESLEQEFTEEVRSSAQEEPKQEEASQEPVAEAVEEPVAEAVEEPVAEVVEEPVAEAVEEPVLAQVEHPVVEETETLQQVVQAPEVVTTPEIEKHDDNVHQLRAVSQQSPQGQQGGGAETSMNFKVEGNMKLDLVFNISGKEVHLNVNEAGLEIQLDGGAKFSLPLEKTLKQNKAA